MNARAQVEMSPEDILKNLTRERLVQLLSYDETSGHFLWRARKGHMEAGASAGSPQASGYIAIKIDSRLYKAHRLAWLYVHGEWPFGVIDHINGVLADNRILNLRDVSVSLNAQNQRSARRDNALGVLGVRKTATGKYQTRITLNGKTRQIGAFASVEEASAAYIAAKRDLHATCSI